MHRDAHAENAEKTLSAENSPAFDDGRPMYVVGIGASAGGLEALERFFEKVPVQSGLAFVVLQHLSPDFKSMTGELLARGTSLPIHAAVDGMVVQRDAIHLLPPKKDMIISDGKLLLTDKDPTQAMTLPIDRFFRSLAQDARERSIGIILSGTGSDGSRGIRDIHDAGGLVMAQTAETAKFDGMPNSAVKTGVVDASLPPEEMPAALMKYVQHPLSMRPTTMDETAPRDETGMDKVFRLLRTAYDIDFSHYKAATVIRRTERRLLLTGVANLDDYARRLSEDPDELNALYKDLLIGVTRFFRDKEAFDALERDVLPQLIQKDRGDDEFRVWVAGCATGEEAYSLAILIQDALDALHKPMGVKIFATDVHRTSIEAAGAGVYPEASLIDVSPERLERYFIRKGDDYQVSPELRKMVVFAQHNLVKDAPFTKLDLISCRNLLIYLQSPSQKKALSLFHFGLKTGGVLFLGPSETPGELEDEFDSIEKHWKLYRKRRDIRLPTDIRLGPSGPSRSRAPGLKGIGSFVGVDGQLVGAYDSLLEEYMPPSWLVNEQRELVQSFAGASRFLRLKEGRLSTDLLDLVDTELRMTLTGALQRTFKEQKPVVYKGLRVASSDGAHQVNVTVKPLPNRRSSLLYALVQLEDVGAAAPATAAVQEVDLSQASREHLLSLESELRYTKENLQATIEELETSNEELQATNEELVASNEELQSTNEELHSVNEELYTVNAEYQKKILELTELTSDMDNLLSSTEVHTIFLDANLCIRKFTPKIAETFNLLPQDVGRKIDAFTHTIDYPRLLDDLRTVLGTRMPIERQVRDHFDRWFLMRILPYRAGTTVEGVVLTLVDVTSLKRAENQALIKDRQLTSILQNSPNLVSIKDLQGRFVLTDASFETLAGCDPVGKTVHDIFPQATADSLDAHDRRVIAEGVVVQHEVLLPHSDGPHTYLSIKFPIRDETGRIAGVGEIDTDVTQLKQAESTAIDAARQRERFLAVLSHELRNPLAAILSAAETIECNGKHPEDSHKWAKVIERRSRHMARLLDDLLDVSRITRNAFDVRKQFFNLDATVDEAIEEVLPRFKEKDVELVIHRPDVPLPVDGDPHRLQQIQVNLLANAVKFTPPGGRVSFAMQREMDRAVIRVRDTGTGIAPEMLRSVFDLFVQGLNSGGSSGTGIGVGLALVKAIAELHGGEVNVYSEGLGQGSEFIVSVPLAAKPAAPSVADDAPPQQPPQRKLKILLVEDDDDIRELTAGLLKMQGHLVETAGDSTTALATLSAAKPDVALIDIGLPGVDGYGLATEIRRVHHREELYLAAMTGYGQAADRERAIAAGFNAHLTKPVKPAELQRLLESVVSWLDSTSERSVNDQQTVRE